MRSLVLIASILLLSGCGRLQDQLHPGEAAVLASDWLEPETEALPETIYCYRTIGREDCHRVPLRGERGRLIEHYGPPPSVISY